MNENSILHQCLIENKNFRNKDSWFANLNFICENTPNQNLLNSLKGPLNVKLNISHLQIKFKEWWYKRLFDDKQTEHGNKLRNYRTYKNKFIKEEYLNTIQLKEHRGSIARLRLSCHKLHIETGRFAKKESKLLPSERLCKLCNINECEDEFHFVIKCNLYSEKRNVLMVKLKELYPHVNTLVDTELFIWLMANLDSKVISLLSKYISECFKIRISHQ